MESVDPLVAALWTWIEAFMGGSMQKFILYAKESGLSMPQIGALFHIQRGSSGVSDIGDDLGVTSAAASQMLERLVQQELILRTEDPRDRRVKQIVLTDKGRRIIQEAISARQGWLDNLAASLDPDERELVTKALNILIEKTNQLENTNQLERTGL